MIDVEVFRGRRTGRIRVILRGARDLVRFEYRSESEAVRVGRLLLAKAAEVAHSKRGPVSLSLPDGQGSIEFDVPEDARTLALLLVDLEND